MAGDDGRKGSVQASYHLIGGGGHNKDIKTRQYQRLCLFEELENIDHVSTLSVLHYRAADLLRTWLMFTMTTDF